MNQEIANDQVSKPSTTTGKVFTLGISLLCVMVVLSVAIIFVMAKQQAEDRERQPVIRQPVDTVK
ncbi:MAG: hypothetical protein M2R45_00100 [Verrucomicrobia subdivision 3 bacterium]|nr:hypothetical protein [Limisphaerales bacterium]MCS1412441.1 hypothetical protein [Limisphaerales bacterium]